MAKYKIDKAPKGRAYVNIVDPDDRVSGPRLVRDGDVVTVADDVIPGEWMKPIDAIAKAAAKKAKAAREAAKVTRLRQDLAKAEAEASAAAESDAA